MGRMESFNLARKSEQNMSSEKNHHHHVERAGVGATIDKKRESV